MTTTINLNPNNPPRYNWYTTERTINQILERLQKLEQKCASQKT